MEMKFAGAYPRCFDNIDQYRDWWKAARVAYPRYGPCTDCLPEFQLKMIEENRCEQTKIKFRVVEDGVEGFIPTPGNNKGSDAPAGFKPKRGGAVVKVYGYNGEDRTWFLKPEPPVEDDTEAE